MATVTVVEQSAPLPLLKRQRTDPGQEVGFLTMARKTMSIYTI